MKRFIFLNLCLMFFAMFAFAQTPQTIRTGFTVERKLGGADKHIYEVNLTKGQLLNFIVEQRGVDVVLRIDSADGKLYDRVDSPNGRAGDEPFRMVSLTGGRFRVEVNPYSQAEPTGKYFVKMVEIRPATGAELKTTRLREELLKIVAEDVGSINQPDTYKRFYAERAFFTSPLGYLSGTAALITDATNNPFKPTEGFSFKAELSEARMEDFGDFVLMSVRSAAHFVNPPTNTDRTTVQRIGYVFKRANGGWRIANVQRTYIERESRRVKLDTARLDALVGVYENSNPTLTLTVLREGSWLFGKFPSSENKFELIPESENTFIAVEGALSIVFVSDANGVITQAVVHYSYPENRMTIQKKIT